MYKADKTFLTPYTEPCTDHIAFPVGGMGAGMFTLQGTGCIGNFSLCSHPNLKNEPNIFAALYTKSTDSFRVLEGTVPKHKIFIGTGGSGENHGNGLSGKNYGLPRFKNCTFDARFPFATVSLSDENVPLSVQIEGWSPFSPGDSYNASLPFGCIEYTFTNNSEHEQESVFYFNSVNLVKTTADASCYPIENGFAMYQPPSDEKPWEKTWFHVTADESAYVDTKWFRGGWWDSFTMLSNTMLKGEYKNASFDNPQQSQGATLSIPFKLDANSSKKIRLFITWYSPISDIREMHEFEDKENCTNSNCECNSEHKPTYAPWYSGEFSNIESLDTYIKQNVNQLYTDSKDFSNCFFASTLPAEIIEAVAANLSILKSPTVLRQTDGRIWAYEGCFDNNGCCAGSCTHVWNYAMSMCNLFPELERTLRATEFFDSQNDQGHQQFRSSLPIGNVAHDYHAASDGQLGGIIKLYRDWRISGNTEWLKNLWPKAKQSLMYCINTWDPDSNGVLTECHHNTYDIEFWGADIMCTSFYLGALFAAHEIAKELSDPIADYFKSIYLKGKDFCETKLYNGEYFYQLVQTTGLRTNPKPSDDFPETKENFENDGPKYQYGTGCISDGVIGCWISSFSGLPDILDREKVKSHLQSIYKYNFKSDLSSHVNPQRPGFAYGNEGGLLLCSWPKGGRPELPFVYSDEVWTGIEYEVASYLISMGCLEEGLDIVRTCRSRYSGEIRNPFNEYECGHWYARAMASYALLQAYSGAFYDNITKTMTLLPKTKEDFTSFISTETGYGLIGIKDGKPFIDVRKGNIEISEWKL